MEIALYQDELRRSTIGKNIWSFVANAVIAINLLHGAIALGTSDIPSIAYEFEHQPTSAQIESGDRATPKTVEIATP